MEPTLIWSFITTLLSALAFLTYKHPLVARKIMYVAMGVIALWLFLFLSWRKSLDVFMDIASHSMYAQVGIRKPLDKQIDSLQALYPSKPDTIIKIIRADEQVQKGKDSVGVIELRGMTTYFERLDESYNTTMEAIDKEERYVTVFGYGLIVLFIISYLFEEHGVASKSKE